eukprot:gene4842-5629_t
MKWLSSKYAYPLMVLSLVLSIVLQAVWLQQLFISQKALLKQNLEVIVSTTAKNVLYQSVVADPGAHKRFDQLGRLKSFFMSDQWMQMRRAYDDLKVDGLRSRFDYNIDNDSTVISMKFNFSNVPGKKNLPANIHFNNQSEQVQQAAEFRSRTLMDSLVNDTLRKTGLWQKIGYALYDYGRDTLVHLSVPKKMFEHAAYRSGVYSYNLKHLHKYQLIVLRLDWFVLYTMRYYVFSSALMIFFTALAFYFILRLMKNQRLYADAKIAFTSNMTHEFKTPVATVAVALESIKKYQLSEQPEKLNNYLDISLSELQRLNIMIEKVLHLNEDGLTFHKAPYDVIDGIDKVLDSLKVQTEHYRAVLRFQPDRTEPCFVMADALQLNSVFYNLIDNALKYASPNAVIAISCFKEKENMVVFVGDNGPGIEEIYKNKIFERFFRIPDQDVHNVKGSGLGLHYVKEIVEEHGGKISMKSEIGKGTTFKISIPAI